MSRVFEKFMTRMAWVVLIVFVIRCAISWKEIVNDFSLYELFGFAGEAITVTAVIAALYEKILWKYDPFLKWPVLNGKYEGEVKSNFDGSERKIVVQIKQSLFSIFVLLKTEESSSKAISAKIIDRDGENVLTYTYINRPKTEVRDRSEIHYGTAILSITDNYEILEGGYYTDRNTAGDMVLRR